MAEPPPSIEIKSVSEHRRKVAIANAALYALSLGKAPGVEYAGDQLVQGVRLACNDEMLRTPMPRFSVFETPRSDLISRKLPHPPHMSIRIELPLAVFLGNLDNTNAKYANRQAENILRHGYTHMAQWGMVPVGARNPGTMEVFRQDLKPLLPQHLEAFCTWLDAIFATWTLRTSNHPTAIELDALQMENFDRIACKEEFQKFWEWWKGLDRRWKAIPSPYEM